jgi:hypothetical protein
MIKVETTRDCKREYGVFEGQEESPCFYHGLLPVSCLISMVWEI